MALKFGENLRRCRRRAALSQAALGELASLHRTAVVMLENGTRLPRIDTMIKLANALEISPLDLLTGIEWKPSCASGGTFVILNPPYRR
ncbi:MAG: helix-turn-helix transcriptional regulator [Solirubrobacterales bacterium]